LEAEAVALPKELSGFDVVSAKSKIKGHRDLLSAARVDDERRAPRADGRAVAGNFGHLLRVRLQGGGAP
jgi:hypothetical protein